MLITIQILWLSIGPEEFLSQNNFFLHLYIYKYVLPKFAVLSDTEYKKVRTMKRFDLK